MLFRIQHGRVDINIEIIQRNDSRTRGSQRPRQLQASKDVYSFYLRTISDWNRLSTSVTDIQTLQGFRESIVSLPSLLLSSYHLNVPVHSSNWSKFGREAFYLFYQASQLQGNRQSAKVTTLTMEDRPHSNPTC